MNNNQIDSEHWTSRLGLFKEERFNDKKFVASIRNTLINSSTDLTQDDLNSLSKQIKIFEDSSKILSRRINSNLDIMRLSEQGQQVFKDNLEKYFSSLIYIKNYDRLLAA